MNVYRASGDNVESSLCKQVRGVGNCLSLPNSAQLAFLIVVEPRSSLRALEGSWLTAAEVSEPFTAVLAVRCKQGEALFAVELQSKGEFHGERLTHRWKIIICDHTIVSAL